jgi:uncharacterized membrane protein
MDWKPADYIRIAGVVGGILLCIIGTLFLWVGIGANGTIDLKSSLFSGTIQSASAGLFVMFFGFLIVCLSLVLPTNANRTETAHNQKNPLSRALFWLFCSFIVFAALGSLGLGSGFGVAASFLAFALVLLGGFWIASEL